MVRKVRPDVVHVHGGEAATLFALCAGLGRVPVVVSVYGRATRVPRLAPSLANWRDVRSTPTGLVRRGLISGLGYPATRIALARGRVAALCTPDQAVAARFGASGRVVMATGAASIRPRLSSWQDPPTIAFAGRAERARGLDDLVVAFEHVRHRLPAARLRLHLLAGRSLPSWRSAPPGVELVVGSSEDLEADLGRAQVVAVPFRFNLTMTPPLVAAEAMSVGVPVVGTDVTGLAPLISDGVNGRLVRPGDHAALASALLDVLGDAERWERLAAGAHRTIAESWSWDHAASAVASAYVAATASCRVGAGGGARIAPSPRMEP
jgi:glycosyltransferase involved in cell wall biosynthesis